MKRVVRHGAHHDSTLSAVLLGAYAARRRLVTRKLSLLSSIKGVSEGLAEEPQKKYGCTPPEACVFSLFRMHTPRTRLRRTPSRVVHDSSKHLAGLYMIEANTYQVPGYTMKPSFVRSLRTTPRSQKRYLRNVPSKK